MQRSKKRIDIATILYSLFLIAVIAALFMVISTPRTYDAEAGYEAWYGSFSPNLDRYTISGISKDYLEELVEIPETLSGCTVRILKDRILQGSSVKHVLMRHVPEQIDDNAFAGTQGVTVYTDLANAADQPWAKDVTIRPAADFEILAGPTAFTFSDRPSIFADQFMIYAAMWCGSLELILTTTVPFLAVIFLLAFLRGWMGFGNPLGIIFRKSFYRGIYFFFCILAGLLTAAILFCECGDLGFAEEFGWDLYPAEEFLCGIPLQIIVGAHLLIAVTDIFHKDFPWFVGRIVTRLGFALLFVLAGAVTGALIAVIITRNMGLFRVIAFIGLLIFDVMLLGGGSRISGKIRQADTAAYYHNTGSSTAIAEDGSTIRINRYSHGTYVGSDQIVGEGDTTMTGASGKIYKKH